MGRGFSKLHRATPTRAHKIKIETPRLRTLQSIVARHQWLLSEMARPFPYTYISCPCAETPTPDPSSKRTSKDLSSKNASPSAASESGEEAEEQAFDPRSPRTNFSLYPPEQLLFCEDCHQIKCPRCITEEIVCWYCPNCLFETPSSMVRSEGNRLVDTLSIAWFRHKQHS